MHFFAKNPKNLFFALFLSLFLIYNNKERVRDFTFLVCYCCRYVNESLYHSKSFMTPSSISTLCVHPNECSFDTSISLRIVPSGFVASNSTSPSKPTALTTNSDSSRIVSSLPVPTLMWQLRISPKLGMAPPRPAEWFRSTAPSVEAPKCTLVLNTDDVAEVDVEQDVY